ncbi:MAG: restriction endonuclease FokI C-terminal domain-containing protein [Candidatus Bathyarchaeia archaeon]|jgi:hypothetical protein
MNLNSREREVALNLLESYTKNGERCLEPSLDVQVPCKELDEKRLTVIGRIAPLLNSFFDQKITLEKFKLEIDSINKRNRLWGFKGMNGMMFFNMLYNSSQEVGLLQSLHQTLLDCLKAPRDLKEAKEKLARFVGFVGNINHSMMSKGMAKRKAPKTKSSLFFLSYFWQIQDPEKFPIFYNSLEISFKNLGFLTETEQLDLYYESFFELNNCLKDLFAQNLNRKTNFWDVEHIVWNYYNAEVRLKTKVVLQPQGMKGPLVVSDDFLPPVISDLPLIARNDDTIQKRYVGKELEDVFEDKVYLLFRLMKFEVEKLGRGKRGPDGIAKDKENHYAIIYDCKCRMDKFSLHAVDDRTLIEYIDENKKKLKKEGIEKIYFMIISSDFDVSEKQLRKISVSSGASSIIMMRAELLLSVLKRYFMDPDITKEDLEMLFAITGVIKEQDIEDILGA